MPRLLEKLPTKNRKNKNRYIKSRQKSKIYSPKVKKDLSV